MNAFAIARFAATAMLFLAVGSLPSDYYMLMRFVVCVVGGYGALIAYRKNRIFWTWAFGVIALLFNPFVPVHLDRSTWVVLDLIAGSVFLISLGAEYVDSRRQREAARKAAEAEVAAAAEAEAAAEADARRQREAARKAEAEVAAWAEAQRAAKVAEARAQALFEQMERAADMVRLERWQDRAYRRSRPQGG